MPACFACFVHSSVYIDLRRLRAAGALASGQELAWPGRARLLHLLLRVRGCLLPLQRASAGRPTKGHGLQAQAAERGSLHLQRLQPRAQTAVALLQLRLQQVRGCVGGCGTASVAGQRT